MLNFKAVGFLTIISVISLILNVLYHILQVDYFGITRQIETYFVALSLTSLGLSLTLAGHIGQLALPVYLEKNKQYKSDIANSVFYILANWLLVIIVPLVVLLFYTSPIIVAIFVPGFERVDQLQVQFIFQLLIITLPFQIINILSNSYLNAQNIYGRVELVNTLRIIISIFTIIFFYDALGIYALIVSYWLEVLLNFFINMVLLKKVKFNYRFEFSTPHFDHKLFLKQAASAYMSNITKQCYNFILTTSVSFLPAGVYAIFKYTENILTKISAIVVMPINTVFFTEFAQDFSEQSKKTNFRIAEAINFGFLFSVGIIAICISFGHDILHFLWGNQYNIEVKKIGYLFLVLNILTLLFFTLSTILFRAALVYKQVFRIYLSQGISWLLSAAYAYLSITFFDEWGLGSVIIFIALCPTIFALLVIYQYDKQITSIFDYNYIGRLIILLIVSLIFGYFINQIGNIGTIYNIRWTAFVALAIKISLLSVLFLIQLKLLRIKKILSFNR